MSRTKRKKHISEWQKQEKFLEYKMGIKGGCGRSNHSVYETATSTAWGCGLFIFLGLALALCGSIYEVVKG